MPHFNAQLIPAMVTPFKEDGNVDYGKMEALAVHLVDSGCDGLLVNGTTGESPTTTFDEKIQLIKTVQQAVQGKQVDGKNIQIMAGTGGNNTVKAVEETKKFADLGVDAILSVVPYYSKPSQRGMVEHFSQIAQAVSTEIIIYNIPSRCVVLISPDTMATLHEKFPHIIGVKQSCPDMDAVSEITHKLPSQTWLTWSGDDSLTLPMMACGAHGIISVQAHVTAPLMKEMIDAFKAGNQSRALELHLKQLHIGKELFFLPNPTVVKTCLSKLGHMGPTLRAPMVAPDAGEMQRIDAVLKEIQALQLQGAC
ncbi:MAG: 4-hydroxy-tetrahydrodipicolinate synthase [Vampirovibrio sp.]|nr:4-hydroxy-tetrahydrodipicolinate synthase [Vampirovibrio sp.]